MCKPIRVASFVQDSITDGPGLRFTLFVQGCDKFCEGCHNPSTWETVGGSEMTTDELFQKIKDNILLTGVTFSGGEPFLQASKLLPLAKKIKEIGLELAIYTGDTFEHLLAKKDDNVNALLSLADILVDGPFLLKERTLTLKFRGSKNQRIINVKESLKEGRAVIETSERWN